MFTVYVLYSLKDKKTYIGCSQDINKRLLEHNLGKVPSTKYRRPLKLVYKEELVNEHEAFLREKHYKSSWGRRKLKKTLGNLSNKQ